MFIGDYPCKIDAKGRLSLPAAFKKQLQKEGSEQADHFVVKRDIFEKCLVLYPIQEWSRQTELIRASLNPYNKAHNRFLRELYRGMVECSLDNNNRLLIPKRLLDYAEIEKEVVLAGMTGKIEIWADKHYSTIEPGSEEFAALAEDILGHLDGPKL